MTEAVSDGGHEERLRSDTGAFCLCLFRQGQSQSPRNRRQAAVLQSGFLSRLPPTTPTLTVLG